MFGMDVNNNNGQDDLISITSNANNNDDNGNQNQNQNDDNDSMPSQMSQEQSDLTQAQNSDSTVWTSFSGFQGAKRKADNAKCNLLN